MELASLETERQVVAGNKVQLALAVVRPTPLTPATVTRGESVIVATQAVSLFAAIRPVTVNNATARVVIGLDRMLVAVEWVLHDAVIAQGDDQRVLAAQVRQVRAHLFSEGTEFMRGTMNTRWSGLVALRGRMQQPAIAAVIDAVGMRLHADHVLRHIELFGHILGEDGGKASAGEAHANATWTESFRLFMAQVLLDYQGNAAIQGELLGAYYTQLADQRAVARATRRKQQAAKKQANANALAAGQANAPAPAPPPAPPADPATFAVAAAAAAPAVT